MINRIISHIVSAVSTLLFITQVLGVMHMIVSFTWKITKGT